MPTRHLHDQEQQNKICFSAMSRTHNYVSSSFPTETVGPYHGISPTHIYSTYKERKAFEENTKTHGHTRCGKHYQLRLNELTGKFLRLPQKNIGELTETVSSYINFCVETTTPTKQSKLFLTTNHGSIKESNRSSIRKKMAFRNKDKEEPKSVIKKGK
ncbi:hypothetical protein ElyMa_002608900 [Elysia marginata]|uniref:Uncharacterized protein n=1 Tax=Elysia marginata TaxID=1093978 RepID=A0AAV4H607_9GAST|nr:hypothetical protein ElyMa_002608900 [Elysia marginata]